METIHHNEGGMSSPMFQIGNRTESQLCLGIQDLLDNANISDPAQIEAYQMFR